METSLENLFVDIGAWRIKQPNANHNKIVSDSNINNLQQSEQVIFILQSLSKKVPLFLS